LFIPKQTSFQILQMTRQAPLHFINSYGLCLNWSIADVVVVTVVVIVTVSLLALLKCLSLLSLSLLSVLLMMLFPFLIC